ncbi:UNVERIFIED_CONTAM: putative amino-acid acetyltransferase NAGS1, chloroplastic [Sesamum latifolium]|uniref:Amino-acid acetyltransferase NAGS1, chloroplastic n=1 Tax=Sesamum latifolium TaxID=2727402 RepID=A0AAW2Y8T9_9LAMI
MAFVCMAKTLQLSPCLNQDRRLMLTRGGGGVGTDLQYSVGRVGDQVVMWRNKKRDSLSVVVRCSADVNGGAVTGGILVEVMRAAQPYHLLHRGCTLVVVLSSEIVDTPHLSSILEDISLLHGLGIKFVLVPGTHVQIDRLLSEKGSEPKYVGNYRITDSESLNAAMNATGKIRILIEAKLSPQPSLSGIRRHGDTLRWYDGVSRSGNNFLAAKRRGVVEGIDYGSTGEVKKIDATRIRERLDQDCIVLLSNLGYSSFWRSIKLQVIDVDMLIRRRAKQCETTANCVKVVPREKVCFVYDESNDTAISPNEKTFTQTPKFHNGVGFDNGNGLWSSQQGFAIGGRERMSRLNGYLPELAVAAFACRGGIERVHLLDGTIHGVLLKELFQRDGVGTVVASNLYEGMRMARLPDLYMIKQLLFPSRGVWYIDKKDHEELLQALDSFIIVEKQGQIIACAALFPFFEDKCGEVAAVAVSPEYRGQGQGDKLLDYIEKKASSLGLQMLFLLTTRTTDWFVRRGFIECSIERISEERRKKINMYRGSKYYMKKLLPDRSGIHLNGVFA